MRARRILLCALASLVMSTAMSLASTPAFAGIPAGRFAVGDSVMLGALDELRARGFVVNAVESRRYDPAAPVVRRKAANGHLPLDVIVHLGTNGLLEGVDCDRVVRAAGAHVERATGLRGLDRGERGRRLRGRPHGPLDSSRWPARAA